MRKMMIRIIILFVAINFVWSGNPYGSSADPEMSQMGMASFYSYECANQPMANGKNFDPEKRTAASWFYDLGTVLAVKSIDTGLITEVVVTDRGPSKKLVKKGRVIDLSKRAFQDICALKKVLTSVTITVVNKKE